MTVKSGVCCHRLALDCDSRLWTVTGGGTASCFFLHVLFMLYSVIHSVFFIPSVPTLCFHSFSCQLLIFQLIECLLCPGLTLRHGRCIREQRPSRCHGGSQRLT